MSATEKAKWLACMSPKPDLNPKTKTRPEPWTLNTKPGQDGLTL
jgi:hypothetical protein